VTGNIPAAHAQPATGGGKGLTGRRGIRKEQRGSPPQVVSAAAAALAAELASSADRRRRLAFYRIPPFLLPIYQAAAARVRRAVQILAADQRSRDQLRQRPVGVECWRGGVDAV